MHVDELGLPTVPEPKPEDPEDVSWALSTAEAMWARGDHTEGIKWVRRAAEAASEAEDDGRALELAKAAADLTGLIAKRTSRASIDIEEVVPMSDPAPPPVPPKKPAMMTPSAVKPPAPKMQPTSVTKQVTTPSRPPAPLPSKTSQPPPAAGKGKPLGTNTGRPPSMKPPAKKGRRSREGLEAEAKAAEAIIASATAELPADTAETAAIEVPFVRRVPEREIGHNDPTFVGHVNDIQAKGKERTESKSAAEWDADSTQNLTGDELPFPPQSTSTPDGDRKTAVVAVPHAVAPPPPDFKSTVQSLPKPSSPVSSPVSSPPRKDPGGPGTNPPATVVGSMQSLVGAAPSSRAPHPIDDPQIVTSQAVRVVVWRDATGVHVAPAGTVVSAITVDAVLVALEPNADLTAWLTQKGR